MSEPESPDDPTLQLGAPSEHARALANEVRRRQVHASLFAKPSAPLRFDRFRLLELIGAGGMGELYLAHDEELDRKVALKLVRTGRHLHRADDRLLREAQALAKISHPNVVPVYQAGRAEGRVYVAMEYVRGRTLAVWLDERRAPLHTILAVFLAAGRGLAAVHAAGLAHRDFKPDNVLIGDDERVRVVDFGLARSLESESDELPAQPHESTDELPLDLDTTPHPSEQSGLANLTATGTVLGTPRYMAPEQWEGRRGDARSDQFSFCVALYEAVYGTRPFDGHTRIGLARAVMSGSLPEPPRRAEVPAELRAAILRGLAFDPLARHAELGELLAVLDRVLTPSRVRARVLALAGGLALALSFAIWSASPSRPLLFDPSPVQLELDAARHLAAVDARMAELDALGRHDDAEQAFAAFARAPEHAGTHALARGWLAQAERRASLGDHEGRRAALVETHLDSSEPEQRAALVGLAAHFAERGQELELAATLDTLRSVEHELGPLPASLAGVQQHLELLDALRRRDHARARTLSELPGLQTYAALVRELGRSRTSHHRLPAILTSVRALPSVDLDADGRGELVVLPQGGERALVLAATPELTLLDELGPAALGLSTRPDQVLVVEPARSLADAPSYLACRAGTEFSIVELRGQGGRLHAEPRHRWTHELPTPTRWTLADLDRVLGPELIGAESTGQQVIRVGPSVELEGGWRRDAIDPSTYATRSVLNGVLAGDLDGDGVDELIVAASEWSAYDLRVLQLDPNHPDRVQMVARIKLGTLSALALLPDREGRRMRVGVMVSPRYPNRRMFPADAPGGLPEGYYQLSWAGRGEPLEIVDHVADARDSHEVHVGDVDGDGHLDLALASTQGGWSTTLLHGREDGRFEAVRIAGLHAVGVAQLDEQPDAELLMVAVDEESQPGGPLVVVGAGTASAEPPASPKSEAPTIPGELDPSLARRWARAEQLAAIGLAHEAADALEQLASLAPPESAERARMRAAALLEPVSRPAANALDEAAGTAASLTRALERHADDLAYADALRVGERLLAERGAALDDDERLALTERLAELRRLAAPPDRRVFEFDAQLDPGWRIESELALRREPGSLRVETLGHAGQRVLARRPLVWSGGELDLEIELDLVRLEWGAGIQVELRPLDQAAPDDLRPLALGVEAWGGSGTYELGFLGISDVASPSKVGLPLAHPSAEVPPERRRFRLGLHAQPSRDRLWFTLAGSGVAARVMHPLGPRAPGRYELVVQTTGWPWVRGLARIDSLVLRGLDDDPLAAPPTIRQRVSLALAEGDPDRALALLADAELERRDAALLELLALDELGRFDAAARRLEPASAGCADDAATRALIGLLLLGRPDRFGPPLRELCPAPLLYDAIWTASETILQQHPEVSDVPRTLTTLLLGLERATPGSREQALTIMRLLRFRAHGWAQQDASAAERADLQRAIELGLEQLDELEPDPDELARRLVAELSHAHRELALALIERGELDAAIDELDAALRESPTPELVADRIVAEPGYALLLTHERWRERLELHRSGRGRP